MKKLFLISLLSLLCLKTIAQLSLQNLKTENLRNPIGIESKQPRFSWQLVSPKKNVVQTAYELTVNQGNKTVWTSGKVASAASLFNVYRGNALPSNTLFSWKVRVWDNQGQVSDWATATFQTALNKEDWTAKWINSGIVADTTNGIVPMLRKTFQTQKKVVRATAYVTARGMYEVEMNGA
ncbi:MAG: alpha-L-rhamnosidase, partial [Spirosomataceae bacterium]